jgi:hypothetical protein
MGEMWTRYSIINGNEMVVDSTRLGSTRRAAGRLSVLRYTLPFLSEPYATNFDIVPDAKIEKNGMGYLTKSFQWNEAGSDQLNVNLVTQSAIQAKTLGAE